VLLRDTIFIEQGTGKKTLVGLFENPDAAAFPTARPMGFFARLNDLEGSYHFDVRVVRLDGDKEELMGGAEFEYKAEGRLAILGVALNLPPAPFSTPGRYEFQL
jgi:hypothetical protein